MKINKNIVTGLGVLFVVAGLAALATATLYGLDVIDLDKSRIMFYIIFVGVYFIIEGIEKII